MVKNSSQFFSELVRVRGPNNYTLLIGTIKPYNICYWHFLLRSFLNKILDDPFHQTKKGETNKTVVNFLYSKPPMNNHNVTLKYIAQFWTKMSYFVSVNISASLQSPVYSSVLNSSYAMDNSHTGQKTKDFIMGNYYSAHYRFDSIEWTPQKIVPHKIINWGHIFKRIIRVT